MDRLHSLPFLTPSRARYGDGVLPARLRRRTRVGTGLFLMLLALCVARPGSFAFAQDFSQQGTHASSGESLNGTISAVGNGTFELCDDGGNLYEIRFYDATVKVPYSLILRPGAKVVVTGYDLGNVFSAKEIRATR